MRTLIKTIIVCVLVSVVYTVEARADAVTITGGTLTFDAVGVGWVSYSSSRFNIASYSVGAGASELGSRSYAAGSIVNFRGGFSGANLYDRTSGTIDGITYSQFFIGGGAGFAGSGVLQADGTLVGIFNLTDGFIAAGLNVIGPDLREPFLLSTQINGSGIARLTFSQLPDGTFIFHSAVLTFTDSTPTPEPISIVLLSTGLAGAAIARRRRRRSGKQMGGE